MSCGGLGALKKPDDTVQVVADAIKDELEQKYGSDFYEYLVMGYKTQVVAGTNFFIKICHGFEVYLHARVYKDLSGNISLSAVQFNHFREDPIEYFE